MHHLPRPASLVKAEKNSSKNPTAKLEEGINETKEFKDRIAVLTIAYHNLAVEQEFLHMVSLSKGYLTLMSNNF